MTCNVLSVIRDFPAFPGVTQTLRDLQCRVHQANPALKPFVRQRLEQQEQACMQALAKARNIHELEVLGCVVVAWPPPCNGGPWTCAECGRSCRTKAALAAHKAHQHGIRALRAYIGGLLA